ncbi:MAG: hypothetical protein JNM70_10940 [Anaerolineae bacterium]|nr:hypothetical protein [Anaerolineae bacterium]
MPRAVFFNVPGHGHVNPSLSLVAELVRRGHDITYFITESYRVGVEAAGASYQAYAGVEDDYFEARGLSGAVPQRVAFELLNTAERILPELLASTRAIDPDYVLHDGMCPWGLMVAQILRLPAVTSVSLMPLASPSPRDLLNWEMIRGVLPMLFRDFDKGLAANRKARALGRQYRISPLGMMNVLNAYGDVGLSYTSSDFAPYASRTDPRIHFAGWTPTVSAAKTAFPFEDAVGRPLIYVSLGTLSNDNPDFFRMCIEAFTGSDILVLMTTGKRISPEAFGSLPENIAIWSWVPQLEVLQRAAVFVTHAGMNSAHDGLYYGVPLLLVPQQMEQMFTAQRAAHLGAGVMLKPGQVSARTLREQTERLLSNPSFKAEAQRLGDSLRAAGGAARAADIIEDLLRSRSAQP